MAAGAYASNTATTSRDPSLTGLSAGVRRSLSHNKRHWGSLDMVHSLHKCKSSIKCWSSTLGSRNGIDNPTPFTTIVLELQLWEAMAWKWAVEPQNNKHVFLTFRFLRHITEISTCSCRSTFWYLFFTNFNRYKRVLIQQITDNSLAPKLTEQSMMDI